MQWGYVFWLHIEIYIAKEEPVQSAQPNSSDLSENQSSTPPCSAGYFSKQEPIW